MDGDKTSFTNDLNDIEWYSSASASDDQAKMCCSTIIGHPDEYYNEKKLYTEEQLIEAFRLGIATITDTEIWKKFVSVEKYWGKTAYNIMRKMNVGDVKFFPYDRWNAARSAASYLKANFGCIFRVNKRGLTGEEGDIQVKRVK